MADKFVWIVISHRTLDVFDSFDVALERYNQLKDKKVDAEIHKRPLRSELAGFVVWD